MSLDMHPSRAVLEILAVELNLRAVDLYRRYLSHGMDIRLGKG